VITALALLGYAACAAWCAPALLAPLTRRGVSVRAGLAAWLAAMGCVLLSAAVAFELSFRTVAADWPQLTQALCRSVAGGACTPAVYRSALYEGGVAALVAVATLLSAVALWRYGRRVQRSRRRTRAHAEAARLVGRALAAGTEAPGTRAAGPGAQARRRAETVVLDDPRPAAYCVAGRPAAIVVTSGALAVLDPPQLSAVLAHERAHLAHGDHVLHTLTQGLAAAFPGVPLFTRGAAEVARLTEMAADDTAARANGRRTLVEALLAIATGTAVSWPGTARTPGPGAPVPGGALSAATHAIPARVERLLRPSSPARSALFAAALAAALALLAAAPLALTVFAVR
jgi:Zn-dependent protease with chaperone function